MPEGPELRLASNLVNTVCTGRTFKGRVEKSDVSKCVDVGFESPCYVITSESRGKEVSLTLQCRQDSSNKLRILFRFGMSGQFLFSSATELHKHAHLNFFSADSPPMVLSFVDPRRFGSWHITDSWGEGRGPDPMLEYNLFRRNILTHLDDPVFNKPICEVMLHQNYFNGIGNYLRAEILYRAGRIPPFSKARDVLSQLKLEPTSKMADILQLCHDVPLEVVNLDRGKTYSGDLKDGRVISAFDSWLQCYYNPSMRNMVDHNGRTIWFCGEAGPLAPKNAKSRSKRSARNSKSNGEVIVKNESVRTENKMIDVVVSPLIPEVDVEEQVVKKHLRQEKQKYIHQQRKREVPKIEGGPSSVKKVKDNHHNPALRRSQRIAKYRSTSYSHY